MPGGAKKGRPRVQLTSGGPYERTRSWAGLLGTTTDGLLEQSHQTLTAKDDLGWTAFCDCGWKKVEQPSKALADKARKDHYKAMSDRLAHTLVLLEGPNGGWTARCECGWQNDELELVEANDALQDHLHETGGIWTNMPDFLEFLEGISEDEERDADLLEETELIEGHMPSDADVDTPDSSRRRNRAAERRARGRRNELARLRVSIRGG